jgi:glycosyltransferase involved in cell wall biosynthesis
LVIACYNEEPVLEANLREVMDVLDRVPYRYEIILVDDGSRDGTVELIERLSDRLPLVSSLLHPYNMGRGSAVADGIRRARGHIVGYIDIDLQTPAHYLPILIREIEKGADVAIARRIFKLTPGVVVRWILSKGYMVLSSVFLGFKRRDTESGCKVFSKRAILPVLDHVRDPRWFWDTETMALADYHGLDIAEVPTAFIREVSNRSTVRVARDVLRYLVCLARLRRRMGRLYASAESNIGCTHTGEEVPRQEFTKTAPEHVTGAKVGVGQA